MYIFNQKENVFSNTKVDKNGLSGYFANKTQFSVHEIQEYYERKEPNIKTATVNWRIYDLVQNNVITRVGRGNYSLEIKEEYQTNISKKQKSIFNKLKRSFPYLQVCIWDTQSISEFMIHQPLNSYLIVEVEKDGLKSVFYNLKESNYPVFIDPNRDIIENYVPINKQSIIIKPIISESPLLQMDNILTASLEKILVDIFCDKDLFDAYQGNELRTIFREAISKYTINMNRMIRYASRRGKKEKFLNYIQENQINGSNL
ncbi:MAG: hypothetical protein KAU44_03060 [Candidatus Marinimicrobia bacterium]|nr:hypothetical protein [Candidatus Neomarinimicrobiota bacterium]